MYRMNLMVAALCALATGCTQSPSDKGPAKSDGTKTVATASPQRKSLARIVEQPGAVYADEETRLFVRVSGYVSKLHVDIGAAVKPEQVLAELSVPDLVEETNQKKAFTKQAAAEVEQARKGLLAAEANIGTLEAKVIESKALLERWDVENKRMAKMFAGGTIDAQQRDVVENEHKAAAARVLSADAGVRKAKADRDKAKADVDAMEARVEVAKADALRSEAMLGYAKIRAPYAGIVTFRKVNTGDLVQPANGKNDWLFTVAKLDPVRVVVSVPEADAVLVQEKAKVVVSIKAAQEKPFEGTVARTSWALESGARTLRAEVELPNKEGKLRPGMYAYARIRHDNPETWTLPAGAVVKQGDATVCFVIDGGKAIKTPVKTGRTDGQFVEVTKVQQPEFTGKEVVAASAAGLADGQAVQVEAAKK